MPDLLGKSSAWLEKMRKTHLSRQVYYIRAAVGGAEGWTLRVAASVGRSAFEVETSNGLFTKLESRDELITAEDLVSPEGETVEPRAGDRIVEGELDNGVVHEVMSPGGQPAWQWSDPGRITLRIHTKYVGKSPLRV